LKRAISPKIEVFAKNEMDVWVADFMKEGDKGY